MFGDIVTSGVGDVQLASGRETRDASEQPTIYRTTSHKNGLYDPTRTAFEPGH